MPVRILAACVFLLAGACSSGPGPRADGSLVDSEVARYYLESYRSGARTRPQLDARIDALTRRHRDALPTREDLKRIADDFGSIDFAALFFADRVLADDCNRRINQAFARHLADPRRPPSASRYRVLFVPGWDYVENGPITGSDFAQPRSLATRFGLENELVPLPSNGGVEENAQVVAAAVRAQAPGTRIILAGASSAGPAIHLALAELLGPAELARVEAWLNLAGILQGTPLIEWLRTPPRSWFTSPIAAWKGWTEALSSMSMARSRERFARLRIDNRILVVNYLGIPLSGSLSKYGIDNYRHFSPLGPNDGLTLLPDALVPGGATIIAPGRDHFLAEDPQIDAKTVAFMSMVVAALETGRRCDP
jgi:hypothetical protein